MNRYFATIFLSFFSLFVLAQEMPLEKDLFFEGLSSFNANDYQEAEKYLRQAVFADPSNDAAYFYLGLTCSILSRNEDAEEYLRLAVEKDPGNFWYRIKLAQFYAQTDRIEVALSLYEELTEDFPSKTSLYYDIIDLYTSDRQLEKAIETLDKIESLRGVNEATGNARYELLNMQGKYDEAATFLEKLDREYPSARTSFILGDIYSKSKYDDSTAVVYYKRALAMEPGYSPAYFGLAEVYRMNRKFSLFFENINRFLSSEEMNPVMKENYLREIVLNQGFVRNFMPQVDTMLLNTLSAHPSDTLITSLVGLYYIQTDRIEEGKAIYRKNIELYPDNDKVNMDYIMLLYYLKEWKELAVHIESILPIFSNKLSLTEILAVAYWQGGDVDKAINTYNQIVKKAEKGDPLLLSAYSSLGDLYHSEKNVKKSYSYYEKALKINPDYTPVLNNYAYYLSLEKKNLKKALEMSKKTLKDDPDNPTYLDTYGWILFLMDMPEEAKIYFKRAMLYGGKESAVILDHYADVLFVLKEYDLAFIYWDQAKNIDPTLGIEKKIMEKKAAIKNR